MFWRNPKCFPSQIIALFLLSVSPKVSRAERRRFFQMFPFLRILAASAAGTTNLLLFFNLTCLVPPQVSSLSQGDVDSVHIMQHQYFPLTLLKGSKKHYNALPVLLCLLCARVAIFHIFISEAVRYNRITGGQTQIHNDMLLKKNIVRQLLHIYNTCNMRISKIKQKTNCKEGFCFFIGNK